MTTLVDLSVVLLAHCVSFLGFHDHLGDGAAGINRLFYKQVCRQRLTWSVPVVRESRLPACKGLLRLARDWNFPVLYLDLTGSSLAWTAKCLEQCKMTLRTLVGCQLNRRECKKLKALELPSLTRLDLTNIEDAADFLKRTPRMSSLSLFHNQVPCLAVLRRPKLIEHLTLVVIPHDHDPVDVVFDELKQLHGLRHVQLDVINCMTFWSNLALLMQAEMSFKVTYVRLRTSRALTPSTWVSLTTFTGLRVLALWHDVTRVDHLPVPLEFLTRVGTPCHPTVAVLLYHIWGDSTQTSRNKDLGERSLVDQTQHFSALIEDWMRAPERKDQSLEVRLVFPDKPTCYLHDLSGSPAGIGAYTRWAVAAQVLCDVLVEYGRISEWPTSRFSCRLVSPRNAELGLL